RSAACAAGPRPECAPAYARRATPRSRSRSPTLGLLPLRRPLATAGLIPRDTTLLLSSTYNGRPGGSTEFPHNWRLQLHNFLPPRECQCRLHQLECAGLEWDASAELCRVSRSA